MYSIIDCNNFFVSCERVFNPKLRDRPVIVLSNNDGCAISRSNEAKKLGIAMGAPLFTIKDLVQKNNVAVLSSNFALYSDLSARVMSIIQDIAPDIEVYSIDEAFVKMSDIRQCQELVKKLEQYTGIPVSIGIGASRTLAKAANYLAKKQNVPGRVLRLDQPGNLPVGEIWGIGRQSQAKLNAMGIYTAAELAQMSERTAREKFNILMWRTIQELNGIACINLKDASVPQKQIMVSRSFGHRVTALSELQEALATYVSMATEKLRGQNLLSAGLSIFLHTGLHGAEQDTYKNSSYIRLPNRSADTRYLIKHAKNALKSLFKPGYRYQKVGVILCELSPADNMQFDLFAEQDVQHSKKLMTLIDDINSKLGRSSLQFAAAGLDKSWRVKSVLKSKNYIGDWNELVRVKQPLGH